MSDLKYTTANWSDTSRLMIQVNLIPITDTIKKVNLIQSRYLNRLKQKYPYLAGAVKADLDNNKSMYTGMKGIQIGPIQINASGSDLIWWLEIRISFQKSDGSLSWWIPKLNIHIALIPIITH